MSNINEVIRSLNDIRFIGMRSILLVVMLLLLASVAVTLRVGNKHAKRNSHLTKNNHGLEKVVKLQEPEVVVEDEKILPDKPSLRTNL